MVRSWGGVVRSWGGVVRSWDGMIRSWGGVVRSWGGMIRSWDGMIRSWGGEVRSWGGMVRSWGGMVRSWGGEVRSRVATLEASARLRRVAQWDVRGRGYTSIDSVEQHVTAPQRSYVINITRPVVVCKILTQVQLGLQERPTPLPAARVAYVPGPAG